MIRNARVQPSTLWLLGIVASMAACSISAADGPEEAPQPTSGTEPQRVRFPVTVTQASPPPPISGGTLTIAPDGTTAVVADPDRDRVYVVDLPSRSVSHEIALPDHSEPGRVAIDDHRRAYVVLRRAGGLAAIDLDSGASTHREACAHPRGVVFDATLGAVHVTCATGQLVTLRPDDGATTEQVWGDDLRDVVLVGQRPLASRFRRATLHTSLGELRAGLPKSSVAWRTIALPHESDPSDHDEVAMVAQQPPSEPLPPSGWGAVPRDVDCPSGDGLLGTSLALIRMPTRLDEPGASPTASSVFLPNAVLPVDLASNGRDLVVVAAGNAYAAGQSQLFIVSADILRAGAPCPRPALGNVPGQAIAAAFAGDDSLIVQTREPAALHVMGVDRRQPSRTIRLSDVSRADTGHALFHTSAGGALACASCHAEGTDDGLVWSFSDVGDRRTPSLLGTLANTAPYHWKGELGDMRALVDQIFSTRMGGARLDMRDVDALRDWLVALPARAPVRAPSATTLRGAATFRARCVRCHSGPELTNNATVDVGTGGAFQVPSLRGVAWRPPFLHSGCAKTLRDRFEPTCGGTAHGDAGLTNDQIAELVAYLETL